jgi:hypothetical protein
MAGLVKNENTGRPRREYEAKQVKLTLDVKFVAAVDEWRAKQGVPISRPTAIAMLAAKALRLKRN